MAISGRRMDSAYPVNNGNKSHIKDEDNRKRKQDSESSKSKKKMKNIKNLPKSSVIKSDTSSSDSDFES